MADLDQFKEQIEKAKDHNNTLQFNISKPEKVEEPKPEETA